MSILPALLACTVDNNIDEWFYSNNSNIVLSSSAKDIVGSCLRPNDLPLCTDSSEETEETQSTASADSVDEFCTVAPAVDVDSQAAFEAALEDAFDVDYDEFLANPTDFTVLAGLYKSQSSVLERVVPQLTISKGENRNLMRPVFENTEELDFLEADSPDIKDYPTDLPSLTCNSGKYESNSGGYLYDAVDVDYFVMNGFQSHLGNVDTESVYPPGHFSTVYARHITYDSSETALLTLGYADAEDHVTSQSEDPEESLVTHLGVEVVHSQLYASATELATGVAILDWQGVEDDGSDFEFLGTLGVWYCDENGDCK